MQFAVMLLEKNLILNEISGSMAVSIKITLCWDVVLCSLAGID
jgi:hypothetical protein